MLLPRLPVIMFWRKPSFPSTGLTSCQSARHNNRGYVYVCMHLACVVCSLVYACARARIRAQVECARGWCIYVYALCLYTRACIFNVHECMQGYLGIIRMPITRALTCSRLRTYLLVRVSCFPATTAENPFLKNIKNETNDPEGKCSK